MEEELHQKIDGLIKANQVLVFMKGTPTAPQCGFSAATVHVLDQLGVRYTAVNVLEDFSVREAVKTFTNWPTIPQVFIKGEFIGGCDICQELYSTGELAKMVEGIA